MDFIKKYWPIIVFLLGIGAAIYEAVHLTDQNTARIDGLSNKLTALTETVNNNHYQDAVNLYKLIIQESRKCQKNK